MVPRQNVFHRPAFSDTRGTTQGGIVSLTLFNVLVDHVIRTCLTMTVEDQREPHDRLGETVRRCLGVLYADDGTVVSREADWLHYSMNILFSVF